MWLVIFHPSRSTVVLSCSVPRGIPRLSFFFSPASDAGLFVCLFPGIECRCSLFCSRVFSPAAFLCSVPLPVSRPLFLFCRMLSGLFVCLFSGIGCRCSSPLWRGKVLPFTVQSRDHLATITDIYVPSFLRPVRGSLAPRLLLSIPRHSMPAFILSIVPWRIALTWQFEREEPRGAMLRPRL